MKKKILFIILGIGLIVCSCNDDNDLFDSSLKATKENKSNGGITVENGYLNFSSESVFKEFVLNLENGLPDSYRKSVSVNVISDFKSLSDMRNEIDIDAKSVRSLSRISPIDLSNLGLNFSELDDANLEDLEEMTQDEYNIMRAENLLVDEVLEELMDTTLRIVIDGMLYKITEYGTFSLPSTKASLLEETIEKFDKNLLTSTELGESVSLNNGIIFVNSFGSNRAGEDEIIEISEFLKPDNLHENGIYSPDIPWGGLHPDDPRLKPQQPSGSSPINNFHNDYNVTNFSWKNNSVWQKFWDFVRGKDVSKDVKFDKKHRVQLNVYDVNYGFYASSGIRIRMQKRKKNLFVKYWKDTQAEKMVIGFNKLHGEMKFTNPQSFSSITPTAGTSWERFTGTINGLSSKFVYAQFKKFDIVKDWVDDIYMFLPEVEIMGDIYPNQSTMNKIYNFPPDEIYRFLKGQTNKWVFTPIKKQIQPKDPRLMYSVWGSTTQTFTNGQSYIMGVKEYRARKSKSIRFNRSFGFTISNKSVSGFVPTEFKIKDLDLFGAVYYDGQWKGIRFVK